MTADQLTRWAAAASWPAALAAGLLLAALTAICYLIVRRAGGSVFTAGLGAIVCTVYSGDTSWRFARDHLGMHEVGERIVMFGAGEGALLACALMARANKKATAVDGSAGTPGVPGVLVWCITGVQLVPAFTESGFWAGFVRGAIGPVMAALLWHIAMGLEIRVGRPEALSTGLPAQIGHELRERLLSYLGLSVRGRTAEQVTRDRATHRAVRLASRRWLGPWGRAALKASVARAAVGTDAEQRQKLLQLLTARRSADQLRTLDVAAPWVVEPAPQPHPATPLGVVGAELRRMDPVDAVRHVAAAHPDASPERLAALCTEYGVPVTATQVRIALHPKAAQPSAQPVFTVQPRPALAPTAHPHPHPQPDAAGDFETVAASALAVAQPTSASDDTASAHPQPDAVDECAAEDAQPSEADAQPDALILDLAPMLPPQSEVCAPDPVAQPSAPRRAARPRRRNKVHAATSRGVVNLRVTDADAQLLQQAHELNVESLRRDGRKAPLRLLQKALGIGQPRAQRIQAQLPDTLAAATAAARAGAQPDAEGA